MSNSFDIFFQKIISTRRMFSTRKSIYQSNNQTAKQSNNEIIEPPNQLINQSTNQTAKKSIYQSNRLDFSDLRRWSFVSFCRRAVLWRELDELRELREIRKRAKLSRDASRSRNFLRSLQRYSAGRSKGGKGRNG